MDHTTNRVVFISPKNIFLVAGIMGVFWGGFCGGISGFIFSGILEKYEGLIIKGAILGAFLGLVGALTLVVLVVTYNLLSTWGLNIEVVSVEDGQKPMQCNN